MTLPSTAMTFPVLTITISPALIVFASTRISVPSSALVHTFSTLRAMALAKSLIDLRCVQSSIISPTPSINIMLPAVEKSPLSIETVMLVASSTDTSSLPCISDFNPFTINGIDLITIIPAANGIGINSLEKTRLPTCKQSLFSNSYCSCLSAIVVRSSWLDS